MSELYQRKCRAHRANKLLRAIGKGKRQFFDEMDVECYFAVDDRSRVWFFDNQSGKMIFTHNPREWKGFSHGGTLEKLVRALAKYIQTGTAIPPHHLSGHDWGYDEADMVKIRGVARSLLISRQCLDVEELVEIDDGFTGDRMGYFAEGHCNPQEFALQANQEFETGRYSPESVAKVADVKHRWARKKRLAGGVWIFEYSDTEKRGYKPITVVEF